MQVNEWIDIAQKIGSGTAAVLGIGFIYLWKAYQIEIRYSKERDTQTLTVLNKLTSVVERSEMRDNEAHITQKEQTVTILAAVAELRQLVLNHYLRDTQ